MPVRCPRDGQPGEGGEVAVRADVVAGERRMPDRASVLPGVTTDGECREDERAVGDARVDVHAAGVAVRHDVVVHVRGLRILAQVGVVVGRAGVVHVAQRPTVDTGQEQLSADQPVRLCRRLAEGVLLDEHAEDVRDRLVERARLTLVEQPRGVLGDAVRELVADDVEGPGEPVEDDPVTVAEDHLPSIPERVVVPVAVVDGGQERHALAVQRVSVVCR